MNGRFEGSVFRDFPAVGIMRNMPSQRVAALAAAALAGGLTTLEVTVNSPDAMGLISRLREQFDAQLNVGAGTVCNLADLERALAAGAEFIVTPIMSPEVIAACRARAVPIACGAFTPTEIYRAWELGADWVKIFPADSVGPAYVKALRGPFPTLPLMPTGGVTLATVGAWRAAGATALGIGSPLFPADLVQRQDWPALTAHVAAFRAAWLAAAP